MARGILSATYADSRLPAWARGVHDGRWPCGIGTVAALAAGRVLSSLLFEVSPHDSAVLASVAVLLLGVALIACLVPARRATQVDAMEVLRGA